MGLYIGFLDFLAGDFRLKGVGDMKSMLSKLQKALKARGGLIPFFVYRTGIEKKWDDEKYICFRYKSVFKNALNLKEPKLFSEKMQWLKLYNRKDEYTRMVDKYESKKLVADLIGERYIIPSLGVWKRFDDIDFDKLPDKFVLKTTHDSGGVFICKDRSTFNIEEAKAFISRSLARNYYSYCREWPYKNVEPRIIAEEYLENDQVEGLHDYKVWCFNGHAEYVQYITGRISNVTYEGFYDRNWALQSFSYHNPLMKDPIKKPEKLKELLDLAEILANGIPFSRIDFYILQNGDIKFGEITFFPMSGLEKWHPEDVDLLLGNKIVLPEQ